MTNTLKWFLLVTFTFLIGGIYTGDRIFFMGFGVCVAILFYSLATALWVLLDFNYTQSIDPAQAVKGSRAVLQMEIHNDKLFLFPYIKIYYQTPESKIIGTLKEKTCSILPLKQYTIREEIYCDIRGRFPLGMTKIQISDLFGLFNFTLDLARQSYHRPLYIDVWPRILHLTSLPIPQIDHEGSLSSNMIGTEEFSNISDIRQYRFGDPLKKIHWKLSSKLQEIQVKNYETDTQPEILFYIDSSYTKDRDMVSYKTEDQVVECATAIIYYLLSNWISLEMITYSDARQGLTARNLQDFDKLYAFLTQVSFSSSFTITEVLKMEYHTLSRGTGVFLIVKNLSPQLFNILFIIKDSGISLLLFYVRDPNNPKREDDQIIEELDEKGINTIAIDINERLDKVLGALET